MDYKGEKGRVPVAGRPEEPQCLRCGKCCQEPFARHVSPDDLARWEREGRHDIIAAYRDEERTLENEDFLRGYKRLKPCRFLESRDREHTFCVIYQTRPRMCREFKTGKSKLCPARDEHGETRES